jgi:mono/diheme cytochrome c family protein
MRRMVSTLLWSALALSGCSAPEPEGPTPWREGAKLPDEPQAEGDPARGRELLISGDYMTCGIPWKLYQAAPALVAEGLDATGDPLPGRTGKNEALPYSLNAFTTPGGVEVVNANCLGCHGGRFDGDLVIGLGDATADFTGTLGGGASGLSDSLLDKLGLDAAEKAEAHLMFSRAATIAPYASMHTIGMNPAEMFAVVLMMHHDRATLAWSDEPLVDLVVKDAQGKPIADPMVTSDPPPWWRAHKKNALFYNGMARGDHRGTMALATSVCVDTIARAQEVDDMFRDIQAFVNSVRPPAYKRPVNTALALEGKPVFERACAGCHGTYDADPTADERDTYPNLLLPLDVIGTDPVVANAGVVHAPELVDWYNGSFYGKVTRMVPNDPFPGYVAPPLDGIWATAPYLHNGSVPTLELVLDSHARPARWKRVDLDDTHFDEEAVGWPWVLVETPLSDLPPDEQKLVYDTSLFSQSNGGHTFGDALTKKERRAVLEYLKTL